MPTFPFAQTDAFTTQPLGGNPCAIVFDADSLSDGQMQAIAREMNLSETAFVLKSERADVRARYFTPAEEIPLAGHPTIATLYALAESGRVKLEGTRTLLSLELKAGIIPIEIIVEGGRPRHITMTQPAPVFGRVYEAAEVLPAFGLAPEDILTGVPIQTVSTGTPQLMIPLANAEALRRAMMDTTQYKALRARGDFFSPHLFILEGATPEGTTFARHFGTPPDTMEDPFTGSATGGMAAYAWHYGLLNNPRFIAEQGHWMNRPGVAQVEVMGPPEAITGVKLGGSAVTVVRGELVL